MMGVLAFRVLCTVDPSFRTPSILEEICKLWWAPQLLLDFRACFLLNTLYLYLRNQVIFPLAPP